MAPSGRILPTHAASSTLNGPELNGENSDRSSGNDGDNHPIIQPCPRLHMLAAQLKEIMQHIFNVTI